MAKKPLTLRKYALSILRSHGCHRGTYRDEYYKGGVAQVVEGLREAAKDNPILREEIFGHAEFSPEEIVAELFAIGNAVKAKRPKRYYILHVWPDSDEARDEHPWCGDSLAKAKEEVLACFHGILSSEGWAAFRAGAERWNAIIGECGAAVYRSSDDKRLWRPSALTLKRMGWVELRPDEMTDEKYDAYAAEFGWPARESFEEE